MKTFVVALYNAFDNTILMRKIAAKSDLEACKLVLSETQGADNITLSTIASMQALKSFVFDLDHSIEVLGIEDEAVSGGSPRYSHWRRHHYPAGTQVAIQ